LLLNYFEAAKQYSSGVVEGLNAKVKLTLKRSYGFRTENGKYSVNPVRVHPARMARKFFWRG
jgi:hypothetical protein